MHQTRREDRIRGKMKLRGIDPAAVETFLRMVRKTGKEKSAYVPLDEVCAPDEGMILDTPSDPLEIAELERVGKSLLPKVAVIKLNGGRSTTMGGGVPKGILEAKDGRSYLEIIVRQVAAVRERWQADIPLVLMNSFFTHGPTMRTLSRFEQPVITFIQRQVPRLLEHDFTPLETGSEDDWVPPGHGDVYESLQRTGTLSRLRKLGCRWAFISNLDNLAAYPDPWILGLIARENAEFLLEVTDRTGMDRKGGTLVVRNGKLDLLEIAQVSPEERETFMDIDRFRVFNTNNVWVDLEALSRILHGNSLWLPIIQNRKTVDGTRVVQLETAMGAAIRSFERSRGLRVRRDRFFPTKKVADLFVLQSDACRLDSMFRLRRNPARPEELPFMPAVLFDPAFLDRPETIARRFEASSSVSMVEARSLEVAGNVYFERDVKVKGSVEVVVPEGRQYKVSRGTILRDARYP